MTSATKTLLVCSILLAMISATTAHTSLDWQPVPPPPDKVGFTGVGRGVLLVAGGANFPDKRPREGGTKIWYDRVFALEPGATTWRDASHLPSCANCHGVAATTGEDMVLIAGDARRTVAEVWLARWGGRAVGFTASSALPRPLAMAAGAVTGRTLYVAAGLDRPDAKQAQRVLLALDVDKRDAGWRTLEACPDPERFLVVDAAYEGAFCLFGDARLVSDMQGKPQCEWLRDAWRYTPDAGWQRLVDLPRATVVALTSAPIVAGRVLVLGGHDGTQVNVAPTAHRGSPRNVLAYDLVADTWSRAGDVPFSLVTTSATTWREHIVVAGGEARPGVRSPSVYTVEAK
jgi:N-acetylneuraminic acid mutarotase